MKKTLLIPSFLLSLSVYGQSWNLIGNPGTNPATNFLGTTDNQPLIFKANDVEKLRISPATDRMDSYVGTTRINAVYPDRDVFQVQSEVENASNGIDLLFLRYTKYQRNNPSIMTISGFPKPDAFGVLFNIRANGNIGIGTHNPQSLLDVYKNSPTNSNEVMGIMRREPTSTGGSAIFRVGYHSSADLEVNTGYTSTALRYGNYFDLNIVNNYEGGSHGAINFVTNSKLQMTISPNGNASLYGKLEAKEVKVTTSPTADFVFEEDYALPTLEEVEKHIKEKRHLPEIASANEMEKDGVNIGEFQIKLLQKIEELTLYSIEQNKQLKLQSAQIKDLQKQILQKP